MIRLDKVSVTLGGRQVVSEASFAAEAGRLTAIIGPNGSGKTTTLRAISGDRTYSGHIEIEGRDLRSMSAAELALERGVLQQSVNLGFPFRVKEILEMGIIAGNVGSAEEAERIMLAALRAVDLEGFEDRVATALSGGEQSRMHMARVLCQISTPTYNGKARWLFLDEPVAALDVKHQLAIMKVAKSFADQGGGVLAVMHDLNLTAMFADHVVMYRQGRIFAAGTPAEVLTPSNLSAVYGCELEVIRDSDTGRIRIHPAELVA